MAPGHSKLAKEDSKKQTIHYGRPVPIPLVPTEKEDSTLTKGQYAKIDLKVDPEDKKSKEYSVQVKIFSSGTPEEFIKWKRVMSTVYEGLGIKDGKNKYIITKRFLANEAQRAFVNAAVSATTTVATSSTGNSEELYETSMKALTESVFPENALAEQKRYMRRQLRKPRSMKIKEFYERLLEMDTMLEDFPGYQSSHQKNGEDVLKEIIEFGSPRKWQELLYQHNVSVSSLTILELVERYTRFEVAEEIHDGVIKPKTGPSGGSQNDSKNSNASKSTERRNNKNNRKSKRKSSNDDDDKWCELHKTKSHNTGECLIVLDQAKKMRGAWEAQHSSVKKPYTGKYKSSWKSSANTEELNAMIQKAVEKKLSGDAKSTANKKRKVKFDESSSDEDNYNYDSDNSTKNNNKCYVLSENYLMSSLRKRKRMKKYHCNSELVAKVYIDSKRTKYELIRVLLDTGTSSTLSSKQCCKEIKTKRKSDRTVDYQGGCIRDK